MLWKDDDADHRLVPDVFRRGSGAEALISTSEAASKTQAAPKDTAMTGAQFTLRCRGCEGPTRHRLVLAASDRTLAQCLACADLQCLYEPLPEAAAILSTSDSLLPLREKRRRKI